jgi:hypothetical protein
VVAGDGEGIKGKEVIKMSNGYGRGFGRGGGGWGFGFRGSSPPWPFVGVGRGGLPRCGYFLSGVAGMPIWPNYGYSPYYAVRPMPFYGAPYLCSRAGSYAPQMTREQELDFLKSQAEAIKGQLEQMGARIKELETE